MGLLEDIENEKNAVKKASAYAAASRKRKKSEDVRYVFQGLELLVEATAFATTSVYAIYSAQHNHMPHWAAVALTVAGAIIALRAFVEFVKLLNRRA